MPKKSRFRGPFDKQHDKRAQALLKSGSHSCVIFLISSKSIFLDNVSLIDVQNPGTAC